MPTEELAFQIQRKKTDNEGVRTFLPTHSLPHVWTFRPTGHHVHGAKCLLWGKTSMGQTACGVKSL